jgi:hypothetical protein
MYKAAKALAACVAIGCGIPLAAITNEKAAQLFVQFLPQSVAIAYQEEGFSDRLQNPLEELGWKGSAHFRFLDLGFPGDSSSYVLLAWGGSELHGAYWRLLKSTDGEKSYTVAQDSNLWYQPLGMNWGLRAQDLTADGLPEILLYNGPSTRMQSLSVLVWRGGQLVCVSPHSPPNPPNALYTDFESNTQVALEDLDGDGKAEVICYASLELQADDQGNGTLAPVTPTLIYRYNGTSYVLWKEVPATDPFPVTVPSLAVVHPGTIPLWALASPGKGELQVFVSHPAGTSTVDDMDANAFTCKGAILSMKKRWPNNKQPDTTFANWEWEGVPVKQIAPKNSGEWNPPPEDPFMPSPDGKTEYHFVAPYLELRLPNSVVYPVLLQQANDAFAKDPSRQTYFLSIPIAGKMNNGKLLAVSALVCIKKTGSAPQASDPAKAAPKR